MTTFPVINAVDNRQTVDANPVDLALFEFPHHSVARVSVEVLAVREDQAVKAWTVDALIRRNGSGLEIIELIPAPPNLFASSADAASMAAVTITTFSDSTYVGIHCTGQAGHTIDWLVRIFGNAITQG